MEALDLDDIAVVSWDVDGTLYRGADMRREVMKDALRSMPWGPLELLGLRRFHWAVEASRGAGGQVSDVSRRLRRPKRLADEVRWCRNPVALAGPRPGVLQALRAFAARDLPQVAFSDYHAQWKLDALGLSECFERCYAGEALGWVKPSPRGLFELAKDYGVTPQRVLHIGDKDANDGAAARAAGARYLILDDHFRDFFELARAVEAK